MISHCLKVSTCSVDSGRQAGAFNQYRKSGFVYHNAHSSKFLKERKNEGEMNYIWWYLTYFNNINKWIFKIMNSQTLSCTIWQAHVWHNFNRTCMAMPEDQNFSNNIHCFVIRCPMHVPRGPADLDSWLVVFVNARKLNFYTILYMYLQFSFRSGTDWRGYCVWRRSIQLRGTSTCCGSSFSRDGVASSS